MQYSKFMIDLVYQIRRSVPQKTKPVVKLSNPDLLDNLLELYFESNNKSLRADIENLMTLAGSAWIDTLRERRRRTEIKTPMNAARQAKAAKPAQRSSFAIATSPPPGKPTGKLRSYRGVKITDN